MELSHSSTHVPLSIMDHPEEGERASLLRDMPVSTDSSIVSLEAGTPMNSLVPEATIPHDEWEYAGEGEIIHFDDIIVDEESFAAQKDLKTKHALGTLVSTAISGNDITSSCFYTVGLVMFISGKFAPISLILVAVVLLLYRTAYSEVGTALPLNGGTYNILLNTTNKLTAAIAASLTILSYTATAVVSANTAMTYAHLLSSKIPILWATIGILFLFALLTFWGIGESAAVAFILFVLHLITLVVISGVGITTLVTEGPHILIQNWNLPPVRSIPADIFFGFCAGLLGVSGYESSSNFIEEQAEGVFPKTLMNMAVIVSIFNPLLAFLATALIPVSFAASDNNQLLILGEIARISVGYWLEVIVSVDAILVLSGAVLTSYVGVTGLVRRMALDRCLPQFLLNENKFRGTNHWIVLIFFLLTSTLILMVNGNPITLSGVYTVAFLSVLALFAVGNLLLKFKRSRLPRNYNAPVITVLIALGLVLSALIGNIVLNVSYLEYFSIYFLFALAIVLLMLTRTRLLKWLNRSPLRKVFGQRLEDAVKRINQQEMIFFSKTDDISILNKAVLYVRDNELTDRLRIVHVYQSVDRIPPRLETNIRILDEMYPKHRIDLGLVKGTFNPALVEKLTEVFHVPKNFMYITTPSSKFPHRISDFGGVRLITH